MKNRTSALLVSLLLGSLAALPAGAASVTYTLDRAVGMDEGTALVEVILTENGAGGVDFAVALLGGSEALPDGAGIREFAFNIAPGSTVWWKDVTALDDGWKATPREKNAFGLFDVRVKAKGPSAPDSLAFTVAPRDGGTLSIADLTSLSIGPASAGHAYFSAKLWGMGDMPGGRPTLAAVTDAAVVPIPATAWLLASALGMAGVVGRRVRSHG